MERPQALTFPRTHALRLSCKVIIFSLFRFVMISYPLEIAMSERLNSGKCDLIEFNNHDNLIIGLTKYSAQIIIFVCCKHTLLNIIYTDGK